MSIAAVNDVPIIGQQLTVEGYTIAIAARCQCQPSGSLVALSVTAGASGTIAPPNTCARCGLGYEVQGIQMDSKGRLTFAVAVLSTQPQSH